ncbi:MAG: hypothetical protein O7H41_08940 [Planctomycetota bacterium]|nr:hypothetical protein [Planctomycetota bacterium]
MPASRVLLAVILMASSIGCASLSAEQSTFFRQYSRFMSEPARRLYLDSEKARPEVERVARKLASEEIRMEFLVPVIEGRIIRGMNEKEVRYSIGPARRSTLASTGGHRQDVWVYEDEEGEGQTLLFEDGILEGIGPSGAGPMVAPEIGVRPR